MPNLEADFSDSFRNDLIELMRMRRDVRRFLSKPIPSCTLKDLLCAATLAPSVGLSQPWRFVSVHRPETRQAVVTEFEAQNKIAAAEYEGNVLTNYQKLKLSGLREAPEHLAVFVQPDPTQGKRLGRLTMPEAVTYSVVAAIQNLWLLARAKGIGVGWVSILRPEVIRDLLDVPEDWELVAYLCLGYPEIASDDTPQLEREGWETRSNLEQHWLIR